MVRYLSMDAIVRLRRFPFSIYANHRLFLHLSIIWVYDFRGMVSYPDWPRSLVCFSFPRWLDCPFPPFANYLLSLPLTLLSFVNPGYAGRPYLYNASRYVHDGTMYIWVNNADLQVVSNQFCRDSARQSARRRVRWRVRCRVRQHPKRLTLRTKPIFRHIAPMIDKIPCY